MSSAHIREADDFLLASLEDIGTVGRGAVEELRIYRAALLRLASLNGPAAAIALDAIEDGENARERAYALSLEARAARRSVVMRAAPQQQTTAASSKT